MAMMAQTTKHRKNAFYLLLFLISLSTTTMVGCTFLQKTLGWVVSRPQVHLRDISVKKAGLEGILFEVALAVNNPNQFDLTFEDLKYQLHINDTLLAEGRYEAKLTIPSDGSINLALPIAVDINRSFKILKQVLAQKSSVMAHWSATAFFVTPVGNLEVKLDDKRPLS